MKRQRVVLYNPEAVFYTMPLSLLALASNLDRERFEVTLIDGRLGEDPLAATLKATADALCLGVTVLSGAPIRDALRVSRAVKERRPDLPVIWGGWHPSLFPLETLDEASIDVTVQGQGEETFNELVERLAERHPLDSVAGCSFRVDGAARRNPARPLREMGSLPPHDYETIDVEAYFARKGQRQLDFISSTGCFWRCTFCADPFVFNRSWTALSPARLADDVERLARRYGIEELAFQDETFFTYRNRVVAIAEEFLRRGLGFRWTATMRADQGVRLSAEDFALCVRSGLDRVLIGVESGSSEMLRWMKKDITLEQVEQCAARCLEHQVGAIFPFIVGFPEESEESFRASLALARRLRAMSPRFETPIFYFKPYPGSVITQEVVAKGHRLPQTLEEWANFDYIGSAGPWMSPEKERLVERFKFYNRIAGSHRSVLRWPLQSLARFRLERELYALPIEKLLLERVAPAPQLS
jgi:radical SAM superfamily enzyme YgiQ (UPF0313 family)